jgi:putative lipoic acid-binding regulatory protein
MRELGDIEKNEGQGFQFPGSFEITAMGNANAKLRERVAEILRELGLSVLEASVRERSSSQGNYVSVSVVFNCPSGFNYVYGHAAVGSHPYIGFTLLMRCWGGVSGGCADQPVQQMEMSPLIASSTPVLRNTTDVTPTTHLQSPFFARPPPWPPTLRTRLARDAGVHRCAGSGHAG